MLGSLVRFALIVGTVALSVNGLVATTAFATAGYKATAVVSKRVPADVLTVTFHLIERSHPERESRLRTEEARIKDEIRKTGATIQSWSSLIALTNAGFNSTTFNYINPSSTESQAVDVRRNIIVRLTGLADAEPIAAVLGRNAIRHGVTFQWSASTAQQAYAELELEAIAAAVAKARQYAVHAGGTSGAVLDVSTSHPSLTPFSRDTALMEAGRVIGTITPPVTTEVIEDDQGRALILRATATVTLRANAN